MEERTCPVCGGQVVGRSDKIYCSKKCLKCAFRIRRSAETSSRAEELSKTVGACEECGCAMTLAVPRACGGFTKRRFCSTRCRERAKQRRHRKTETYSKYYRSRVDSGKWADANRRARARRRKYETILCPYCGIEFRKVAGSNRVICGSVECERASDLDRVHERHARLHNVTVEHFSRTAVFERDDWTCRICGEPIDRGAPPKSPMSASLDHVVPLAKGGEHSMRNTQCAHLRCNMIKSDRDLSEVVSMFV